MKKNGVNCRHFVSRAAANKHATVLAKKHGGFNVVVNVKLVKRAWNYTVCMVPRSKRIKLPRTKRR